MAKESSMKSTDSHILTINGGSSSIKFALSQAGEPLVRRLQGKLDRIGLSSTNLSFTDATGKSQDSHTLDTNDRASAIAFLLDWLETRLDFASVKAVGRRVVHGMTHNEPERVYYASVARRTAPHHAV
jgi:acetate kinase